MLVPHDAEFFDALHHRGEDWHMVKRTVGSNYNLAKTLVALFQTSYAASTLYRARGNQIDIFGYAAFGLTVTPYLMMSVLNLLASLICPEYPAMFLVESADMREARRVDNYRHGDVAVRLKDPESNQSMEMTQTNAQTTQPEPYPPCTNQAGTSGPTSHNIQVQQEELVNERQNSSGQAESRTRDNGSNLTLPVTFVLVKSMAR